MRARIPHARDVIVLMAYDAFGDAQYGWYVRWQNDPYNLRRLSYATAESVWTSIRKDAALKTSSLNEIYLDSYFSNTRLDFNALVSLRLESFRNRHEIVSTTSRKRGRELCQSKSQRSKPASPDHRTHTGQCTICLDENIEVHPTSCCGAAGATCSECRAKLRHICPVCDRHKLNASYQCLTCNAVVALKDYGLPCSCCSKCVLCVTCYKNMEECAECDVVRCCALSAPVDLL